MVRNNYFLRKNIGYAEFLIPKFIKEGKYQLVIAIGCTGGKHRSVAIANKLSEELRIKTHRVKTEHRDIDEESYR